MKDPYNDFDPSPEYKALEAKLNELKAQEQEVWQRMCEGTVWDDVVLAADLKDKINCLEDDLAEMWKKEYQA